MVRPSLILDHAGAYYHHGLVEDPIQWTLDPETKAVSKAHEARQRDPASRLTTCTQCDAIRAAGEACPQCGHQPKRPGEWVAVKDGELGRVERSGQVKVADMPWEEKKRFYQGLLYLAEARGQKIGVAYYRYRAKFGEDPPRAWRNADPIPPSPEVAAWDRHCRIKYAKAKQAADRAA